jgi:hypothetical protein
VHPTSTSMTKRLATMIAAVLVLFVTAMPAAAVCCLGKTGGKMAAMHASMPCCAGNCTMSSPSAGRDHDVTLTPAPSAQAASTVAAIITPASPARGTSAVPATERAANEFSSPPPFLINAQFRI